LPRFLGEYHGKVTTANKPINRQPTLGTVMRVVADFVGLCVGRHLNESLVEFSPDLVVYVAGTSVLCTDEAGGLSLTAQVSGTGGLSLTVQVSGTCSLTRFVVIVNLYSAFM